MLSKLFSSKKKTNVFEETFYTNSDMREAIIQRVLELYHKQSLMDDVLNHFARQLIEIESRGDESAPEQIDTLPQETISVQGGEETVSVPPSFVQVPASENSIKVAISQKVMSSDVEKLAIRKTLTPLEATEESADEISINLDREDPSDRQSSESVAQPQEVTDRYTNSFFAYNQPKVTKTSTPSIASSNRSALYQTLKQRVVTSSANDFQESPVISSSNSYIVSESISQDENEVFIRENDALPEISNSQEEDYTRPPLEFF